MRTHKIPEKTVSRLSIYLRCLEELEDEGRRTISSRQLAERFGLNSAQLRKDLAYFGQFGVRGLGYDVRDLRDALEQILGLRQGWEVALVGIGNLGSALIAYKGFREKGFTISAVFDADPRKVGQTVQGVTVSDPSSLVSAIRRKGIKIALVAVPAAAAQSVVDQLVEAGVKAILNFAPAQLSLPRGVKLQTVDLSALLKTLTYHSIRADLPLPRSEGG